MFTRPQGHGLILIVEAKPGSSRRLVGNSAFDDTGFPDLTLLVSDALGDGSTAVCDNELPDIGGIPAVPSLSFEPIQSTINAANDLGCRVDDGLGHPEGRRGTGDACTRSNSGQNFGFAFVDATSSIQFCLPIAAAWEFTAESTIIAARLRDVDDNFGPIKEIVLRITP